MDWAALQPGALFEWQGYRSPPYNATNCQKQQQQQKTTHVRINLTLKKHMVGKEKEKKQTAMCHCSQ